MKKYILLAVAILLGMGTAMSQPDETPKELLDDGNFFFQEEDYEEAIFYFLKLEGTSYMNPNTQYKIGVCYLNQPGQEYLAVPYLEKAITDINPKYKPRSAEEKQAPEHAFYHLGRAYRINNQLDEALETFSAFKEVPDFDKKYNLSMVDVEIEACEMAKIIKDIPISIVETSVGDIINNASDNYQPILSMDERTMVFMTNLTFYDAIFQSTKDQGVWSFPVNITPQVQSDGDAYPTSLSPDGNTLYLIKGERNNRDIYISRFKEGFWTKMEPLPGEVNSGRAESHAAVSADGKTMYISSNRRGGLGEFDIYRSDLGSNGEWGIPKNLGQTINTPFNEEAPFILENGKLLFFTSEGHYNMGGFDIFYSELGPDNRWSDPINIGYPVNTTSDNKLFMPVQEGKAGYVSKLAPDGFGGQDIYRISIMDREEIEMQEGTIDTGGMVFEFGKPFVIKIIDEKGNRIVTQIVYDPDSMTFTYKTITRNLKFVIDH